MILLISNAIAARIVGGIGLALAAAMLAWIALDHFFPGKPK